MEKAVQRQITQTILERAADAMGDITDAVIEEYYRLKPDAEKLFLHHRPGDSQRLKADMVEQALYCFMYWCESPGEIEMTLLGSVPHHIETLDVSVEHYHSLLQATATVIEKTIPKENQQEQHVWAEVSKNLHNIVDTASQYVYV